MKKIVLFLSFLIASLVVSNTIEAQATPGAIPFKSTAGVVKTTLTNTDTAVAVLSLPGNFDVVTIQAIVGKTSGTVAGKVYLSASLDNTNFEVLDSLTNADQATNFKIFKVGQSKYYYYQLYYATSGTQVSTIKAYYVARKQFGQ